MKACDETQVVQPLMAMEDNWDSYGARPISVAALAVVRSASVVPTTQGGVQFEWHAGGWDVELEFSADGEPIGYSVERA